MKPRADITHRAAKCYTCGQSDPNAGRPDLTWTPRHVTGGDIERHKAAGHDIREVQRES